MSQQFAEAIEDLAKGIGAGSFRSEAEISQGVIKRVLHELGWPVFNVQVVAPEFKIGTRKVDYALCHPAGKPSVLVEVKDLGKADNRGQKQLLPRFSGQVKVVVSSILATSRERAAARGVTPPLLSRAPRSWRATRSRGSSAAGAGCTSPR